MSPAHRAPQPPLSARSRYRPMTLDVLLPQQLQHDAPVALELDADPRALRRHQPWRFAGGGGRGRDFGLNHILLSEAQC